MVNYSAFVAALAAFQVAPFGIRRRIFERREQPQRVPFQTNPPRPGRVLQGVGSQNEPQLSPKDDDEQEFLRRELAHVEALEDILRDLEDYDLGDDDEEEEDSAEDEDLAELGMWDANSLEELLGDIHEEEPPEAFGRRRKDKVFSISAALGLEQALLQGVVPVSAGVGSDSLPGDFGFDPLDLANKDLFYPTQQWILKLLPRSRWEDENVTEESSDEPRPKALVLRDYREAEIRHGRLAMLAAIFWPLQEMLDRFVLAEDQFGPLLFGPITLPYFPLTMTAIMLLLGYLDIYSQAIKDMDKIGEAFLPGDCFWDPLKILQGTSDRTKRNMQEREIWNGRAAMIAFAAYLVEELFTHKALIDLESNALLLRPAFTVPFIQRWLDDQFTVVDPESAFLTPNDISSVLLDAL